MLGWKAIFAIISAILYAILTTLLYDPFETSDDGECNADNPCLRFCAADQSKNDELLQKFKNYELYYENSQNFKICNVEYPYLTRLKHC